MLITFIVAEKSDPSDLQMKEITENLQFYKSRSEFLQFKLNQIQGSLSWKLSKPIRVLNRLNIGTYKESEEDSPSTASEVNGVEVLKELSQQIEVAGFENFDDSKSIALIAHWNESGAILNSTSILIDSLINLDFQVVLISASNKLDDFESSLLSKKSLSLICKPNLGYDFGSWAVGLNMLSKRARSNEILLINDSVVGPLADLSPIIEDLRKSKFDVTGLTDSLQYRYHLQSYFLHFERETMLNEAVSDFFQRIKHVESKKEIIQFYEIGLTRELQSAGLFAGALYPWNLVVNYWENPTIHGWKRLLDLGFPFIKKEIISRLSKATKNQLCRDLSEKFNISQKVVSEILNIT